MIRVWRKLTKKDSVESPKYTYTYKLYLYLQFLGRFFMDPDFQDRIRIFLADSDPDKRTRIRNTELNYYVPSLLTILVGL